jgi:hypothetical protein
MEKCISRRRIGNYKKDENGKNIRRRRMEKGIRRRIMKKVYKKEQDLNMHKKKSIERKVLRYRRSRTERCIKRRSID